MSDRTEMISINRYSYREGFFGGYPTFSYIPGKYYNYLPVVKLKKEACVYQDMPASLLGEVLEYPEFIPLWLRESNLLVQKPDIVGGSYVGAIPTFEQAKKDNYVVLGVNFILEEAADPKLIYLNDFIDVGITYPLFGTHREQFKAVHDFAVKTNYVTGIPVYTEADPFNPRERGDAVSALLFKEGFAEVEDIPEYLEHVHWNYTFNDKKVFSNENLSDEFVLRIYKAIKVALKSINECSYLNEEESKSLIQDGFKKVIHFSALNSDADARAMVNPESLSEIGIKESSFPATDEVNGLNLLAETVIHEMMHTTGRTHIAYEESFGTHAGIGCGGNTAGLPELAVKYWTSPPLRAECCIRNMQTDPRDH